MDFKKNKIKLQAYAKINLSLYITGKREDGYHLLDSVFSLIDIYDKIIIKKGFSGINIKCDKNIPADESNTAYKAAKLVMEKADIDGVDIKIKKNIPVMAGLGGGSSDAAAVLVGMNELYNLNLDKKTLAEMGLKIGADVPFFLGEGAARVQGIGEKIKPIMFNKSTDLVIVMPDKALSTAEVYKKHDEIYKNTTGDCGRLIARLKKNDFSKVFSLLHNDLQKAAELLCPDISASVGFLQSNGAEAAIMTGSGSCVFGIFNNRREARTAVKRYFGNGKAYTAQSVQRPIKQVL